jgi:hypothetical protein
LPTRGFDLVVHDERHSRERRERPGYLRQARVAEIEVKEESQKPLLFNKTLSYSLSFETSARR